MHADNIARAEAEAKRFLEAVDQLRRMEGVPQNGWYNGSRWSGSLRRASLDLTRALADMRR